MLIRETDRLLQKKIADKSISVMPSQFQIYNIKEQAKRNLKKKLGNEKFGIEFNSRRSNIWSNISGLQNIKTKEKAKKEIFKLRKNAEVGERFRIARR